VSSIGDLAGGDAVTGLNLRESLAERPAGNARIRWQVRDLEGGRVSR
jgi:hypothetical protein